MNTRQIRDLALKLLGLYYLAQAFIGLPQIAGIFWVAGKTQSFISNATVFVIASMLPVALHFVIAYVLVLKSRTVLALLWPDVEDETRKASPALPLTTWVSLIGLFYLIGSLGGAVSELWMLGTKSSATGLDLWYSVLPRLITFVLAVICIVTAPMIAQFLNKNTESDTQQPPPH